MKKAIQQFILIASLVLLVGCERVDNGNVPAKLNLLEKTFEVQLPTNYTNEYGASLTYARGGSEIVARLEVTDSTFSSWRQSVTNKLSEMHGFKISIHRDYSLLHR